jgi:Zn-dependent protease/CBS domain-containing protein
MANGGLTSGLRIARIFGISVGLHPSWLLIFFLLTYSLGNYVLPQSSLAEGGPWWRGLQAYSQIEGYQARHRAVSFAEAAEDLGLRLWPWWQYWVLGAIGAIGLFVSVLAHEISHSLVAVRAGIPVQGITLFLFGGVARLKAEPQSPGIEFRVAIAGPLMSLAIGLATGALYLALWNWLPEQARALLFYFSFVNLSLVAFNLLPGFPLDGGRLLRAALWKRYGDFARATSVASWWGRAIGAAFVAVGAMELVLEFMVAHELSMGPLWLIIIGLFLRSAARGGYQQAALRQALAGLTIRQVLQPSVVTVEPDLPLDRLVDEYFYTHRFRSFPVLEANRLVGIVGLRDVQAVPRAEWSQRLVREVMHQVRDANLVRPSDDVAAVLRKMAEENTGHLPVVEDGRLVGIVTRHDIMALIQLRTDLGERSRLASG